MINETVNLCEIVSVVLEVVTKPKNRNYRLSDKLRVILKIFSENKIPVTDMIPNVHFFLIG